MKAFMLLICITVVTTSLVLIGCASSDQTSEQQKTEQPPPVQKQPEPQQAQKIDTLNVAVKNVPPPAQNEPAVTPATTASKWTGKFAVQIGAYKVAEKAAQIADIAKDRFGAKVFTVYDRDRDLTKVLVGDFATKDEARKYRDQITKQYPEYADAWVTEFPHE